MALTSEGHRQLLVRCEITNRDGDPGIRFVEHNLFRLWQYMMANKHGLVVHGLAVCLWLPEHEWQAQGEIFQRAGEVEEVHRLSFAIYDRATGLCNTMQRFVPANDADRVRELLLQRISPEARAEGDFAMEMEGGRAVIRDDLVDPASLGHALSEIRPA
ncbi:MAG: hypothetical protein RIB46_16730 [Pseudomonadales bacterium]